MMIEYADNTGEQTLRGDPEQASMSLRRSSQSTPERSGSMRAAKGGVASRYAAVGAFGTQPKPTSSSFASPNRSGVFAPLAANAGAPKVDSRMGILVSEHMRLVQSRSKTWKPPSSR